MKKEYESPKVEKVEFNYDETVVASSLVCKSGLKKVYTDTGIVKCTTTFVGYEDEWIGDNLGGN